MKPQAARFFFAIVIALLGCGASTPTRRETPNKPRLPDEDLVSLMPQGVDILLATQVQRLLAWSPIAKQVNQMPSPDRERLRELIGLDVFSSADRVVFGTLHTPSADLLAIVQGRFESAEVAKAAENRGLSAGQHRGVALWESNEGAVAQLTARTLAFGSRLGVHQVIDCMRAGFPSARNDRPLMDAWTASEHPEASVRLAVVVGEVLRDELAHELDVHAPLRRIAARAVLGPTLDLQIQNELDGPPSAQAWAGELAKRLEKLKRALELLRLGTYLDGVAITVKDTNVRLNVRLTERQVDELAALLGGFVRSGHLPFLEGLRR